MGLINELTDGRGKAYRNISSDNTDVWFTQPVQRAEQKLTFRID